MDDVLEIAEKLSQAIADSNRYKSLRKAEKAVMADEDAVKTVKERDEIAVKVAQKEHKGEPIEPEEKRLLASAEEALRANPLLGDLSRAQADFQEMLNLVNQRITARLGPEKPPEAPAETPPETPAE